MRIVLFLLLVSLVYGRRISRRDFRNYGRKRSSCTCPEPDFGPEALEGEIKSPRAHRNVYCDNLNCNYTIQAGPKGTAIRLHIESFETERLHDYLQINQTENGEAFQMERLSGFEHPENDFVSSEGNGMQLKFKSDGSEVARGFVARFTRFNISDANCICPKLFYEATSQEETISSPNFPNPYCNRIKCYYLLRAPEHHSVKLTLDTNDFGNRNDQVKIYEIDTLYLREETVVARWGGSFLSDVPDNQREIVSRTHGFVVVFESDSVDLGTGFSAKYKRVDSPCACKQGRLDINPGEEKEFTSPGYPKDYCDDFKCTYRFSAQHGSVIQYEFNDFDTEQCSDKLYVLDGARGKRDLMLYCGRTVEPGLIFTTNSQESYLRFETDSSVIRKGFNITYRAIERDETCKCPTPQPRTYSMEEGTIELSHGTTCRQMDCFYEINAPHKESHYLGINLTVSAPSPHGKLTMYRGLVSHYMERYDSYTDARNQIISLPAAYSTGVTVHYHANVPAIAAVPQGSGFSLNYKWIGTCHCGEKELTAETEEKYLTSPNFPHNYCNDMDCEWMITAPEEHKVVLEIVQLSTEKNVDALKVYHDGSTASEGNTNEILSGSIPSGAGKTYTSEDVLTLRFITDNSVTDKGFQAIYRSAPIGEETEIENTQPPATSPTKIPPRTEPDDDHDDDDDFDGEQYQDYGSDTIVGIEDEENEGKIEEESSGLAWMVVALSLLIILALALLVFVFLYRTGRIFVNGRRMPFGGTAYHRHDSKVSFPDEEN